MATIALANVSDVFPAGTSVGLYERRYRNPAGGAPFGSAVDTATVAASGALEFDSAQEEVAYVAYAQVGGEHRYRGCSTLGHQPTRQTPYEANFETGDVPEWDGAARKFQGSRQLAVTLESPLNVMWPAYGATGDGTTDDTAAIQEAIDACPEGGVVFFPPGMYRLTATLTIRDKPVNLIGSGGLCQTQSSAPFIREAATKLTGTFDDTFIEVAETNYASIESEGSSIRLLAIEGSGSGASQVGLKIDNRSCGIHVADVNIAGMGSHGVLIGDCVTGRFANVWSHHNDGDGWKLDSTTGTDSANAAVTNNVFDGCVALSNGGNGIHLRAVVWGNLWLGGNTEGNTGYGLFLDSTGTGTQPRFNRTFGAWEEGNTAGSVRIAHADVVDNDLDFSRLTTTPSFVSAAARLTNALHFADLSQTGRGQRKSWQYAVLRAMGLSASDVEAVTARNRDDTGDGNFRAQSFLATFGLTMDRDDVLPSTIPAAVDAVCLPNGRGITSRNAADNGNLQIFVATTKTFVGAESIPTVIQGAVEATAQTVGTTVGAAGAASAQPATPAGYLAIKVNGTNYKIPLHTA